jgi:hypothetical protein
MARLDSEEERQRLAQLYAGMSPWKCEACGWRWKELEEPKD